MITFHYRLVQTPTGVINRPYALVNLFHGERRCRRIMLIDSGADVSLITRQTGIRLGFTVSPTDEVKYLGGAGGGRIPVIYRIVICNVVLTNDTKIASLIKFSFIIIRNGLPSVEDICEIERLSAILTFRIKDVTLYCSLIAIVELSS